LLHQQFKRKRLKIQTCNRHCIGQTTPRRWSLQLGVQIRGGGGIKPEVFNLNSCVLYFNFLFSLLNIYHFL
jgi:hypothetical protein